MSNIAIRLLVVAATCTANLVFGIENATAQHVDSLTREIAELTQEWTELKRIADAVDSVQAREDSLRAATLPMEKFNVGPLTIVAQHDAIPFVRESIDEIWIYIHDLIGQSSSLLAGTTFFVDMPRIQLQRPQSSRRQPAGWARTFGYQIRVSTQFIEGLTRATVKDSRREIDRALKTVMARAVSESLMRKVPKDLRDWAGPIGPIPTEPDTRALYIGLVGQPLKTTRACWERQWAECRISLGLVPSEDPLADWYDDEDRRALVTAAFRGRFASRFEQLARERCDKGVDPSACYYLLDEWGYDALPLSYAHRNLLVNTALQMGGADAFDRLIRATGTIEEKLVAAAEAPLDDVLDEWRHHINDAAGTPVRLTARMGVVTLLWMFAFMFAATRSTRWRFD